VFNLEKLVRKRREHGESDSYSRIFRASCSQDNCWDVLLQRCSAAALPFAAVELHTNLPQQVICSYRGQLQHFSTLLPSLKSYRGIINLGPKSPHLRLNLTFHFGCNF